MGLQVLITNYWLDNYAGNQLYVRDLALELRRQGHVPAVYGTLLGKVSDELLAEGIPVTNCLNRLDFRPDIIHGHHLFETLSAVMRFPDAPALFVCHDFDHWADNPPLHPRILRYYGVSALLVQRLRDCGIPEHKIGRMLNWVDLKRFKTRPPLPERPQRALLFSNYASNETFLPAISETCEQAGLELTVVGSGVGTHVSNPEDILGRYDIVFAKAKSAIEAMAVGSAVVLCDFAGIGPMVNSDNFDRLRGLNFGLGALTDPHTTEGLLSQIALYDAGDAKAVQEKVRASAGLDHAVAGWIEIYGKTIAEYESGRPVSSRISDLNCYPAMARNRLSHRIEKLWTSLSQDNRRAIKEFRCFPALRRGIRRIFVGRMKSRTSAHFPRERE